MFGVLQKHHSEACERQPCLLEIDLLWIWRMHDILWTSAIKCFLTKAVNDNGCPWRFELTESFKFDNIAHGVYIILWHTVVIKDSGIVPFKVEQNAPMLLPLMNTLA